MTSRSENRSFDLNHLDSSPSSTSDDNKSRPIVYNITRLPLCRVLPEQERLEQDKKIVDAVVVIFGTFIPLIISLSFGLAYASSSSTMCLFCTAPGAIVTSFIAIKTFPIFLTETLGFDL